MTKPLRSRATWLALAATLSAGALAVTACGDDDKSTGPGSGIDGGNKDGGTGSLDGRVVGGGGDGGTLVRSPDGSFIPVDVDDAGGADAAKPDAGSIVTVMLPPCDASKAPTLPSLKLAPVPGVTGLDRIVYAAQPPGSTDWYLVQQTGTLHLLSNGVLQAKPILDLSAQIGALGTEDERGLLSVAFPPDFATSQKLYVMPTIATGADANRDTVLEFTRSGNTATQTRMMLQDDVSAVNHNGGTLAFDKDGLLYISLGDGGGSCNDSKPGTPQDIGTLYGKILRLDPKVTTAPYAATSNPFVGTAGADARVFHYGLRNPFRYSFDRSTGDLYIGDVGQNLYEELDLAPAGSVGLNFGWPKYEGSHMDTCGTDKKLRDGSTYTPPIVDLGGHNMGTGPFVDWISVIGGAVYRGSAIPELQGVYLFGDYKGVRMGALRQCGTTTSPTTAIAKNKDANAPNAAAFAHPDLQGDLGDLTAIVQDSAGEIYLVANRSSLLKVVAGP